MSCKIFRNYDNDTVERVEDPNGSASKLYKDALGLTKDSEEALNIWAFAYTPTFKESFGDWGTNEPSLQDVMRELNFSIKDEKLGLRETVDVHNMVFSTGLSVDSLYSTMKKAFFNSKGQFSIDQKKLTQSKLYTPEEVKNLMEYSSVRGEVLQTLNKMRNSLMEESTLFSEVGASEEIMESPIRITTGEINSLGKYNELPIQEVEKYLKNNIGNFINEEQFINRINSLDREDVREAVLSNPETMDYVRDLVKNTVTIPVFVSRDGILTQKMENDRAELLKNTLTVNVEKLEFTKSIDFLRSIPEESWYNEDSDSVNNILNIVEVEAAKVGLDLTGLRASHLNKSKEEVIGFLDLLDDFNIKTEEMSVEDSDISELARDINEYFEENPVPEFQSITAPEEFKGKNLIQINGNLNEASLYRSEGLVKSFGNIFQRVDVYNDYNSALEAVYEAIQDDTTILPKDAFKLFGLKNGYYNITEITNPENKSKVLASINSFITIEADSFVSEDIEEYDTYKEISLMKSLFNPIKIKETVNNDLLERSSNFVGDPNYLTSDFISDFYTRMLEEKVIKKSELWDTALKYFTVDNTGITIANTSPEILSAVNVVLQSEPILYSNLSQYALISKNENLGFLREFIKYEMFDEIENRRDVVVNHPETLSKVLKNYLKVSDDTLILNNSREEFIKTNEGIYELTDVDQDVSVYSKLEINTHPDYYLFNSSFPVNIEQVDTDSFRVNNDVIKPGYEILVSSKKLKDLEEESSCMV